MPPSDTPIPTNTSTSIPTRISVPPIPSSTVETFDSAFPTIDMAVFEADDSSLDRADWTAILVQPSDICPDWLVYHTDMTGDWEIFRLGELPDNVTADPNLSRGYGNRLFDVMPSRAPDQRWIAFTSNRNGNWEIYISAVD